MLFREQSRLIKVHLMFFREYSRSNKEGCVHACVQASVCVCSPGTSLGPLGLDMAPPHKLVRLLEEKTLIYFICLCPEHSIGPSAELQ